MVRLPGPQHRLAMTEASIVIPSFCGAMRLPKLLEALAVQEFEGEFEVLVVLDGTTDNSTEVVRSFEDRLQLRLVELSQNQGRAVALNRGFEVATGTVLVRCDDDLVPQADFVRRHVRWHQKRADYGVVGLCRNMFPETAYARAYGREADIRHRDEAYARTSGNQWLHWAANCSVHRDMWERVGRYDERYCGYGWEDVDWGYRLRLAGGEMILDPALETEHRVAAITAAVRFDRAFQSGVARARFESLHGVTALPPMMGDGLWGVAVRLASLLRQRASFCRAGKMADSALEHLPHSAGRRVVALGIEAAALAGWREGRAASK